MKFCPNCGQPIEEGTSFCRNCGYNLGTNPVPTPQPVQPNYVQPNYAQPNYAQPKTGKGLSVASLVLGIIAVFYALVVIANIANGAAEEKLLELMDETELDEMAATISFGIGLVLIPTITGVLALIFGIKRKSFSLGKAGIILGSIALIISVIGFIYVLAM